ncbi:hypothetical protein [Mycobacterium sp. MS1601]|uniref:hypothetical protein n=1 Tax=Mycobacterium sp. MS1601 TaxID=1936029 RepID=UPI0012FA932C|nr:hypothetical protein [Mycobacterium sp. MS1601]
MSGAFHSDRSHRRFVTTAALLGFATPAAAIVAPADGHYTYAGAGNPNSTSTMQSVCS